LGRLIQQLCLAERSQPGRQSVQEWLLSWWSSGCRASWPERMGRAQPSPCFARCRQYNPDSIRSRQRQKRSPLACMVTRPEPSHRHALRDAGNTTLTALDQRSAKTGHLGLAWTPDPRQRIDMSIDAGHEAREGVRGGSRGITYNSEDDVQRRRYAVSHTANWN